MLSILVFVAGWLYVNLVEYVWHRWVLHSGHHEVHDNHHRAFFTGEYDARPLLNVWAVVAAAAHVAAACLISLKVGTVLGLSMFSYLGALEALHIWQHTHKDSLLARWHIAHHRYPLKHYNIFLPVWDYLLGS